MNKLEELQAENNRLANRVDDLEHDFGVLAFCGTAIDKRDIESLRTELSGEVVTILQDARARINQLEEVIITLISEQKDEIIDRGFIIRKVEK